MRKKSVNNLFDNIFWYILYAFPIIAYLCMIFINPYGDEVCEPVVETESVYTLTIPAGTYLGDTVTSRNLWTFSLQYSYNRVSYNLGFTACVEGIAVMSNFDTSSIMLYDDSGYSLNDYTFVIPSQIVNIPYNIRINNAGIGGGSSWSNIYVFPNEVIDTFLLSSYERLIGVVEYPQSKYSFGYFFEEIGFGFAVDNIVVNSLEEIFGANGIMPIFSTDTPLSSLHGLSAFF